MTKLMQDAIHAMEELPEERRDMLARAIRPECNFGAEQNLADLILHSQHRQ